MTKEYRITTKDVLGTSEEDCWLDPSDPVFSMTDNLLTKHKPVPVAEKVETWEERYIRENNIKPGTPAWHALRQTK